VVELRRNEAKLWFGFENNPEFCADIAMLCDPKLPNNLSKTKDLPESKYD